MEEKSPRRSRILLIGHTASLGGAELALLRLVQNLDSKRFEPIVLLFADGSLATMLRGSGIEVHCLPLSPKINQASRMAVSWPALFRYQDIAIVFRQICRVMNFIREGDVDLVHTNSLKAAIIGGIATAFARKPLVWYVHDRIASDYLPKFAIRALHALALTLPTFVVGNSLSTLRTFLPKLPLRCDVVYPGVDLKLFPAPKTPPVNLYYDARRDVKIGIVGRLSPTKGQDVFIRAASLVAKTFPQAKFFVIGSAMFNDAAWETKIRQLASEHKTVDIQFMGFCADIPLAMSELDVIVHASTVPEPFGQVVAEAMCCGKPVVAVDAGGIPEVITNGQCGWLVPQSDAERMAERIVWLIEHPNEAAAMGQRGRNKAAEQFTVEKMARGMELIYEQSLSTPTAGLFSKIFKRRRESAVRVTDLAEAFPG